jgi:hypothetical protein
VLAVILIKIHVFWDTTPCRLVTRYQRFWGACCLSLQGGFWTWRQQAPPKRWYLLTSRHGVVSQKTWIFKNTLIIYMCIYVRIYCSSPFTYRSLAVTSFPPVQMQGMLRIVCCTLCPGDTATVAITKRGIIHFNFWCMSFVSPQTRPTLQAWIKTCYFHPQRTCCNSIAQILLAYFVGCVLLLLSPPFHLVCLLLYVLGETRTISTYYDFSEGRRYRLCGFMALRIGQRKFFDRLTRSGMPTHEPWRSRFSTVASGDVVSYR